MKRACLALTIVICGSGALWGLHQGAVQLRQTALETRQALLLETQQLAETRIQLTSVAERARELRRKLDVAEQTIAGSSGGALVEIPTNSAHLTPNQSERLLAELGFNWASSGDYLIVSKDTLRAISLEGMRQARLRDAAVQVLAITPQERAGIEASTQQLIAEYTAWAQAHTQRAEPGGDVVAQYSLAADPDFFLNLSNNFTSGVLETLGTERGNLLIDYTRSWMQDLGMGGTEGANSLTITRDASSTEPRYNFELKYSGNTMTANVSPHQPFPPAFLPLFPNGWPDVARREGFDLPAGFTRR